MNTVVGATVRLPALLVAVLVPLLAAAWWFLVPGTAKTDAQETKRYTYKVVDVPPDNAAMQAVLNEYGAAGWELIVIGMGDLTTPRLIFKK